MAGEYGEKRNRRRPPAESWWRSFTKAVLRPVLIACIPLAGYSVVSWRDDLKHLDLNFNGLVRDLNYVVERQDDHSRLHRAFNVEYARAQAKEVVAQYQVLQCSQELSDIEEEVGKLSRAMFEMQNPAAGKP